MQARREYVNEVIILNLRKLLGAPYTYNANTQSTKPLPSPNAPFPRFPLSSIPPFHFHFPFHSTHPYVSILPILGIPTLPFLLDSPKLCNLSPIKYTSSLILILHPLTTSAPAASP